MTGLTELTERVTTLESEMAEVRDIATIVSREASSVPAVLTGHTRILNALRLTQREHSDRLTSIEDVLREHDGRLREHGGRLTSVEDKLDRLEHKVDSGFAVADRNFATIEANFALIGAGIEKITGLLVSADDKSGEPPS